MASLCFFLSNPTHLLCKGPDGIDSEQLVFKQARLAPGMGELPISYEIHNHESGDKGASYWNTIDVATDEVDNEVRLNMAGSIPDQLIVERPPRFVVHVALSPESFSRLLGINWKEHFIQLTVDTKGEEPISGLKLPFNRQSMTGHHVTMPIGSHYIECKERPLSPTRALDRSAFFRAFTRLFRIVFGR